MAKLSKTAKSSGATGKVKSRGPERTRSKFKVGHRARKGKICPICRRRMKADSNRCQFEKRERLDDALARQWSTTR